MPAADEGLFDERSDFQDVAITDEQRGVFAGFERTGPIADTEGMARLAPTPEAEARYKARLALRDYGTKDDIADAAMYLSSDNAHFVTGTILDCDGGSKLGDASADALKPMR